MSLLVEQSVALLNLHLLVLGLVRHYLDRYEDLAFSFHIFVPSIKIQLVCNYGLVSHIPSYKQCPHCQASSHPKSVSALVINPAKRVALKVSYLPYGILG